MRQLLKRHSDSQHFSAANIEVEVLRPSANSLVLAYIVTGRLGDMQIPPVGPVVRGDKLWLHTCFEAFVRASSETGYYEFNFAPSMQWAAYRFGSYRSGMSVATEIGAPSIAVDSKGDCLSLRASVALDQLAGLTRKISWRLGLSALIEDLSGRKSYWALAHPPGKPDFHHMDAFAHEFSPEVRH
ncbi:MAG TPA: DOMON-like domain-containing protein [Pseudolabrys sp.]|nr:DOMON-like domain-containing protein [Pseudolabrys sp.]